MCFELGRRLVEGENDLPKDKVERLELLVTAVENKNEKAEEILKEKGVAVGGADGIDNEYTIYDSKEDCIDGLHVCAKKGDAVVMLELGKRHMKGKRSVEKNLEVKSFKGHGQGVVKMRRGSG